MNLGKVMRCWRQAEGHNVRDAGKILGVSYATISRLENGKSISGETMGKIFVWLIHPRNNWLANDPAP